MRIFQAKEIVMPPPEGDSRDKWVEEVSVGIQRGDENAFRSFFEAYSDRVFRFCLTMTKGNEDLSRELLQQVMIKCARTLPFFTLEKQLWTWLATVAKNAFVDHLRKASRHTFQSEIEIYELERGADSAETELLQALEIALDELPIEERELIKAIYEQKLLQKQVADLSNTTPKAIENRLCRLRQKLRKAILNKIKTYALI